MTIDLLLLGSGPAPAWSIGRVVRVGPSVTDLATALDATRADAVLCWDLHCGAPDPVLAQKLVDGRGDIWHAGLVLGTGGMPGMIDFVAPNWMLNCDPPIDREATSWRLAAGACLLRTAVIQQMGTPSTDFDTVAGAMLEWGHRCIVGGVLARHVPTLVARAIPLDEPPTLADEIRFLAYRYGSKWMRWAIARAGISGYASPPDLVRAARGIERHHVEPYAYRAVRSVGEANLRDARVTVLIPTLDRYRYLHVILGQLRAQTVRPHEIIIVDQTAIADRDPSIGTEYTDLPLRLIFQDQPGQCASRNAGLQVATGDFVLFIDDDDEIPPMLIEDHLRNLARFAADVSCGVAQEIGTNPLATKHRFVRTSDVFPTNNTLIRREVLYGSGLFDLAFDRAPRADGDLGMRVYLSGAFMVLDQAIAVLHHRAAQGGLRAHRARVITYRTSRESLTQRHLPHISEIYLVSRYFTARQVRESLWMRAFGTLSGHGSRLQRAAKFVIGGAMLSDTIKETMARSATAREWLTRFPQIARLAQETT